MRKAIEARKLLNTHGFLSLGKLSSLLKTAHPTVIEAKLKLAEIIVKGPEQSSGSMLPIILEKYFTEKTDKKPSAGVSRSAGRMMLGFWGHRTRVGSLTEERQKEFAQSLVDKGFALSYASRILTVLNSALGHADIKHRVIYTEADMRERWQLEGKPPRRAFVPTDDELARLLRADLPEKLWRWLLIQMTTAVDRKRPLT